MSFSVDGRAVQLQGLASSKLFEEGSLNQGNKLVTRGIILQVLESQVEGIKEINQEVPTAIQTLLKQFSEVFEEPKWIPPNRSHDQAINLIHP